MRTRSQARRLRQHQQQQHQVPPNLVELPKDTMADNRTIAELLQAPTEGYEEAIVVPEIEAANFEISTVLTYERLVIIHPPSISDVAELNDRDGYKLNFSTSRTTPVPAHAPKKAVAKANKEKLREKDNLRSFKFNGDFFRISIRAKFLDSSPTHAQILHQFRKLLNDGRDKMIEWTKTRCKRNCSRAVSLKKFPEKLGDPGRFLIPCDFPELMNASLAISLQSINLIPLSHYGKETKSPL
ncbi:hypothetical protein Tco_0995674 [Tanacetum coccineum]